MDEIIAQVETWPYLKQLPPDLDGFRLRLETERAGAVYKICAYRHEARRRGFQLFYAAETKEYMAKVTAGLTEFCDINYIAPDLLVLEKILRERLAKTIRALAVFDPLALEGVFRDKKILEWKYAAELPRRIAGFDLYIAPDQPLKIINGSYIVLDYSDFVSESNFVVYYNIYRDEFFGEIRLRRAPRMTAQFDATSLQELEEKLGFQLRPTLEALRKAIDG